MIPPGPRLLAWEVTKRCGMGCSYCRASASAEAYPGELSTEKCKQIVDEIASVGSCILIVSGGDPLLREDIFEIVHYATCKQLRVVMAVNPDTFNQNNNSKRVKQAGVKRVSISLDGADKKVHDNLRGVRGAFSEAVGAMQLAKSEGVEFQINTTVTRHNFREVPKMARLAVKMGAKSFHPFFLVPTGRAENLKNEETSPLDYEKTLSFLAKNGENLPLEIKATCAPHFYRILCQQGKLQQKKKKSGTRTTGCLGGVSFCFISSGGEVQPCGYLQAKAGDLKKESFAHVWTTSKVFNNLRDRNKLKGKCGLCRYKKICGGCRARALCMRGDYLEEEPYCVYQPVERCGLQVQH